MKRTILICDGCLAEKPLADLADRDDEVEEPNRWLEVGLEYGSICLCQPCVDALERAMPRVGAAIRLDVRRNRESVERHRLRLTR